MNAILKTALALAGVAFATQAAAQITFYEREGFTGRSFTAETAVRNFDRYGFNDRASSIDVQRGRWEVCEDARFSGRCVVLRPGRYPSLAAMGLNNRVSSVRDVGRNARIDESRYAPPPGYAPAPVYAPPPVAVYAPPPVAVGEYRRRDNERLYEANVIAVRAVVGPPEQRCWVEREQVVVQERGKANVPGAVVGGILGGILGHQIGSGRGNDLATVGGAVAGAAVGANVNREGGGQQVQSQDVKRCETVPSNARPDHWDVTYSFRGQEHRMQTTAPPGPTITVNDRGEPRT